LQAEEVAHMSLKQVWACGCVLAAAFWMGGASSLRAAEPAGNAHVYVLLWFDTEDYILPQSDDSAKRIAEMLTGLGVRATFKVVAIARPSTSASPVRRMAGFSVQA
jgi:hypothetical protein